MANSIIFNDAFISHMCAALDTNPKTFNKAFNGWFIDLNSKQKKVTAGKKKVSDVAPAKRTCDRIPRGKDEPCGKTAKNELDGKWYCGTEKSGCYKSMISEKVKAKSTDEPKSKSKAAKGKNGDEILDETLVGKTVKKSTAFHAKKVVLPDGTEIHVDPKTKIVFHRDRTAIGSLNKDKIVPLSDEQIRILETNNIPYRQEDDDVVSEEEGEDDDDSVEDDDDELASDDDDE